MDIGICELRDGISKQFTTFNPDSRQKTIRMNPGDRKVFVDINETSGIITRLWLTFTGWFWQHWDTAAEIDPRILKMLIIRIYWDGNDFPSVEAPIGDFFGNGHCEYRHYLSKYLGMSSGGFYSYFPMPFGKGFKIEMENLHKSIGLDFFMNVNYQEMKCPDNAGRFHCMFNCGYNPGMEPTVILESEGRGHYVGCCLSMQGERMNDFSYLEAPEYIYIDSDENRASIIGTGLEDYFNGGWYFRDGEFYGPYHGAPLKDTLRSMISMYRFHEADAINFMKKIKIEFNNPFNAQHLKPFKYSSTAYWYLHHASRLSFKLPSAAKLMDLYRIRDVDHQSIP